MPSGFGSLVVVVVVVALAPIVVGLMPGWLRLPQVVLLLVAGILVGPWLPVGRAAPVTLFSSVGLGFLFLMAGYELDPALLRERAGPPAASSWLVSLVAGAVLVGGLYAAGLVHSPVLVAIALTTTALGTLLPILRDNDMLAGRFGRFVFAAGAVGEFGPIVAMALFLGTGSAFVGRSLSSVLSYRLRGSRSCPASVRVTPDRGDHPAAASMRPRRPPCGCRSRCSSCCSWPPATSASTTCWAPSSPAWCCAGGRPATSTARGQARRRRLRLLHPDLLRLLGHDPRPRPSLPTRADGASSVLCSSCVACRRCSGTAATCPESNGSSWSSSPRPPSRCSSRSPPSESPTAP